jgi:hypothetical protein
VYYSFSAGKCRRTILSGLGTDVIDEVEVRSSSYHLFERRLVQLLHWIVHSRLEELHPLLQRVVLLRELFDVS